MIKEIITNCRGLGWTVFGLARELGLSIGGSIPSGATAKRIELVNHFYKQKQYRPYPNLGIISNRTSLHEMNAKKADSIIVFAKTSTPEKDITDITRWRSVKAVGKEVMSRPVMILNIDELEDDIHTTYKSLLLFIDNVRAPYIVDADTLSLRERSRVLLLLSGILLRVEKKASCFSCVHAQLPPKSMQRDGFGFPNVICGQEYSVVYQKLRSISHKCLHFHVKEIR